MAFNPASPVTGAAITGLTTPTYTLLALQAPGNNAKSYYVSALGGTQTGVLAHSTASPFKVTFWVPTNFKTIGKTNPVTGLLPSVPKNVLKRVIHKGVLPLAGQPYAIAVDEKNMSIPAGADVADPANLKALMSFSCGLDWANAQGYSDTVISGAL